MRGGKLKTLRSVVIIKCGCANRLFEFIQVLTSQEIYVNRTTYRNMVEERYEIIQGAKGLIHAITRVSDPRISSFVPSSPVYLGVHNTDSRQCP
jgi:hypothetical protein